MVTPMQNLAGTLFTNTINLVGGVTLCFLTSWRLSLLAFTTVGPIMVRARAVTAPTRDAVRARARALARVGDEAEPPSLLLPARPALSLSPLFLGHHRELRALVQDDQPAHPGEPRRGERLRDRGARQRAHDARLRRRGLRAARVRPAREEGAQGRAARRARGRRHVPRQLPARLRRGRAHPVVRRADRDAARGRRRGRRRHLLGRQPHARPARDVPALLLADSERVQQPHLDDDVVHARERERRAHPRAARARARDRPRRGRARALGGPRGRAHVRRRALRVRGPAARGALRRAASRAPGRDVRHRRAQRRRQDDAHEPRAALLRPDRGPRAARRRRHRDAQPERLPRVDRRREPGDAALLELGTRQHRVRARRRG